MEDVEAALVSDIPAAVVYAAPQNVTDDINEIRIAFDGDAVLFSDESEVVFQKHGLDRFVKIEKSKVNIPLPQGPFFKLLKMLSLLQSNEEGNSKPPVRIALITARSMPTHERVIRTLKQWNVRVDEAFFMGGVSKTDVLRTFRPHIFFDDQEAHCDRAADVVATALVPSRKPKRTTRKSSR
jgi:5'-nucleotidase